MAALDAVRTFYFDFKRITSPMMISQHYFTFPFYIPRVCALFKNWPLFLFNYIFRRIQPAEYKFRDGTRLLDGTGTLAGTIAVVFVRQEYGQIDKYQTILDIGANMGSFMLYAARSNSGAKIYCYEPVLQNFSLLTKNIKINSLMSRVFAFQYAVAANNGPMDILLSASPLHSFYSINRDCEHEKVECTTLKKIIELHGLEKIDLLKMNCEGAEYEILENCLPDEFERIYNIRLEYHNLGATKRNGDFLARFLTKQGYSIQRFTRYKNESGFIWASRI